MDSNKIDRINTLHHKAQSVGLTEEEKESLKEVVDKEIRRIKYRRHKAETSNLRYVIDLNS